MNNTVESAQQISGNKENKLNMADITRKVSSFRRAIAMGSIHLGNMAYPIVMNADLPKGNVFPIAKIAAIQGVKSAATLMPLCHPLSIENVEVIFDVSESDSRIDVYVMVSTNAKTGVEMEALAGVNAALLTIYDLTKPVEANLKITDIRLVYKEGGKKGKWVHQEGIPPFIKKMIPEATLQPLQDLRTVVITLSDRASQQIYDDESGKLLTKGLTNNGADVVHYHVLPDDADLLRKDILSFTKSEQQIDLIITTGGTGISKRDITPETVIPLYDKELFGIGEALRYIGSNYTDFAWASRSSGGRINETLVITLPGNPKAITQSMDFIVKMAKHLIQAMQRERENEKNKNQ